MGNCLLSKGNFILLLIYIYCVVIDFNVVMLKTNDYIYIQIVLLQEKLGSNCEPHYLEDEGLYVGFRAVIPQSTKLHVEQRLIAAGQK